MVVDDGDGDGKYDDPSGDMILHTRTHYLLPLSLILRIVYVVYGTINIRSQWVSVWVCLYPVRDRVNGEK